MIFLHLPKGLSKNNLDDSVLNYTGILTKVVYLISRQTLRFIKGVGTSPVERVALPLSGSCLKS